MIKLSKGKLPGKLIVFEGTDGAGKTTMIARAADRSLQKDKALSEDDVLRAP